jgi:serine-type D-Ala-D-Ala carboxypeptidase/endopeptidase
MRLFLSLFIALCLTPARAQKPAQAPLPDLKNAEVLGADLYKNSGSTGLVLVVVRDNQVFFHGYGETAPNSHQAPTADSVVRLCSLTKIFTTDLLTKLTLDNIVQLNDPLQSFAPSHVTVPKRVKPITLFDLATHTAGLPRELGNAHRGTAHFTFPDYSTRWRWLPNLRLRSTPGTVALYSNVGYDLLSDALQAAAHKPYATLLAERTIKPLRMYQTTFYPDTSQCARMLVSIHEDGACTATENTEGSAGLYSTPNDMAIWLKYLLGTGTPGIPAQPAAAQESYLPLTQLIRETGLDHAGRPSGIGLGWMHLLAPDAPSHLIEKTGGGAGFLTYITIHPASHTALFLAATDGPGNLRAEDFNLFKSANDLLLNLAGLPPIPRDAHKAHRKITRKRHKR